MNRCWHFWIFTCFCLCSLALIEGAPETRSPSGVKLGRVDTAEARKLNKQYQQKLDPEKDGWHSEAFAEQAQAKLNALGAALIDPKGLSRVSLGRWFDMERVVMHDLRPLDLVKEIDVTPNLKVSRFIPGAIQKNRPQHRDVLHQLQRLVAGFQSPRFKFKVFKVKLLNGGKAETQQFFSISDASHELNATWTIRWDVTQKKMESIVLDELEEVIRSNKGSLFQDVTGSVLPSDALMRDHLGHGINYWQERVQKLFSMHYFGHNGIAIGDINNDGLDDVYLCQAAAVPNKLLVQQSDGSVKDFAKAAGVDILNASRGALLVDLDNDGDQDLAVSTPYTTLVYANDGKGAFSLVQSLESASGGFSLTAVDYDNDGDLDLYLCVYYRKPGDASALAYPIPYHDANNGGRNILLRNDRMKFTDVTDEVGMGVNNSRFSFAASWDDFDKDGDQDVYVANDYGRNNLYRNQLSETGEATFVNDAARFGIEDTSFGMSVCWGDADGDGNMDLYTGNMFSGAGNRIAFQKRFQQHAPNDIKVKLQRTARGNSLFLSQGSVGFRDVTMTSGARQGRWSWGSIFGDVNNDGLEDIIVANGFVTGKREDDL